MTTLFDPPRHAGHLLVQCLVAQGVTHAFGVPGESYLAALDGFWTERERIAFVTCRHEGGAAFMAEAAGKLTRRPGIAFVTRGPGATNASIGVHTAFQDSTPMILFVGDVGGDMRDREAFQEMDYRAMFGPSTGGMAKRVERIDDARRIPEYLARAFSTAMNGRPGPVVLVLPEDMLTQAVDGIAPCRYVVPASIGVASDDLARAREMLLAAERPFVLAGGSQWTPEGARALQRFAERWQLPVGTAFRFQDSFDNAHPLYAGDVGIGIDPKLAARIRAADLVLAIGPRLGEMTTSGYTLLDVPQPRQRLVHIHAGAEELGRVYRADLGICATPTAAAEALAGLEPPGGDAFVPRWAGQARAANAEYAAHQAPQPLAGLAPGSMAARVDLPQVIASLQKHLPPDAVLCNGAGNFATWLHRYFRYPGLARGHKTQLAPTAGAMGAGVPAAIAANLITGRTAFTIAGDGDFQMTGMELSTAVQHGAKTIVLVLNNGIYGTIRMHQEREFPAHVSGSTCGGPDFAALARAFGYHGVRLDSSERFEAELLAALARPEGTLIELLIDPELLTTRATLSYVRAQAQARQAAP